MVDFEPYENPQLLSVIKNMSDEVLNDLSKDHKNLILMLRGVLSGTLSSDDTNRILGKIVQSRWTNTQTRCLRLYMSTDSPSRELRRLVHFIVYV